MGILPEEEKISLGRVVKMETKSFMASEPARKLMEKDDGNLQTIVRKFLESIYIYHDEAPKDLDPSEFRKVVLETLPRRFTGKEKFLAFIPEVIIGYIDYLKEEYELTDPPGFDKVLTELKKKFGSAVKKVKAKDRISDEDAGHTIHKEEGKVGRNDPCPCGSGKKYKKCCMLK